MEMLFTIWLIVWFKSQWNNKKQFNIELAKNEDFKNSTKCWICDNDYVDNDDKVRDHCHITGKYRGSAQRDCKINLKINSQSSYRISQLKILWSSFHYERTRLIQS